MADDEPWEWEQYEHSGAYLGGPGQYLKPRRPRPHRRYVAWDHLIWWVLGLLAVLCIVMMCFALADLAAPVHPGG